MYKMFKIINMTKKDKKNETSFDQKKQKFKKFLKKIESPSCQREVNWLLPHQAGFLQVVEYKQRHCGTVYGLRVTAE